MSIVTKLGVFESDYTILTPDPSPEFINAAIDRECARRVFWLIFISDCVASVLYRRNILATESQLSLRLPMDETCFELSPHTALPGNPSFRATLTRHFSAHYRYFPQNTWRSGRSYPRLAS